MTTQVNLSLVWAATGGTTPVGDIKYEGGWVAEIPTFQNFNYMVQGLDQNILHLAESNSFDWETAIAYTVNAKVLGSDSRVYYCHTSNSSVDPVQDLTNTYWSNAPKYGAVTSGSLPKSGLTLDEAVATDSASWAGQDATLRNHNPMLGLFATSGSYNNLLFGNIQGELCIVNVGNLTSPDSRALSAAKVRVYHEDFKPVVADVAGAVEEAPVGTKTYARKGTTPTSGEWVEVTTTTVSNEPPPQSAGAGKGWYNLGDGQFYIDINDGDSNQWVPANPPKIPIFNAEDVPFDNSGTTLVSTNVQDAIVEMYNLI